jgi:hypothetical protein
MVLLLTGTETLVDDPVPALIAKSAVIHSQTVKTVHRAFQAGIVYLHVILTAHALAFLLNPVAGLVADNANCSRAAG